MPTAAEWGGVETSSASGAGGERYTDDTVGTPAAPEVPREQIPALVAELALEQAAVSALQDVLTATLLLTPTAGVEEHAPAF